jgi:hypothetical protein
VIDRKSRDILAEQIRHLLAGVTTNFQYMDNVDSLNTKDKAVKVVMNAVWQIYDDLHEHKVDLNSFSTEDRNMLNRFILFLKSDIEYKWPSLNIKIPFLRLLSNVFTLGIYTKAKEKVIESAGDFQFWPFLCEADFETAKRNPTYLAKQRTT